MTGWFSYTYDSQGNLLSYTDLVANEKFTYVYDFLGRPVQVRTASGFKIKLTYDEFNRASDVEFVNGTESNKTSWVFGNDSIVTGVKYNGVEKISYTYDLLKRQTAKTINTTNPFVTQYQYKNIDNYRTSTLIDKISYSDGTALSYTYDVNGNILTIADATGTAIASYTYDSLNQLTGATVGSDVYVYTYDNGENIVSKTKNGVEVAYTYGNTEWKDLLTNYNGIDIAYDTIGNPLNWINGETFTWGGGRQLTGITKGENTVSYTYNDSGIRTSKTVNGVRTDYYLNDTAIIMQKTGDNVIWYTYDENGLKTGFTYNGTAYYYVYNLQGDVIALLNSAGETVARYDYDPWGKVIAITDGQGNDISAIATHIANINPFRYRGYYYDIETGLYYLQSRYYDAEVGRFLNADGYISTGQGVLSTNTFVYCLNNSISLRDDLGNMSEWVLDGIMYYYDGTASDFHRLNQGLSPISYEFALMRKNATKEAHKFDEMRIDTDGITKNGKKKYGKNHQEHTSILDGVIDAEVNHYVVIPGDYEGEARLGDIAVVIDNKTNRYVYAIIADTGPKGKNPGEVSISVCWDLGYNSNGYYGPEGDFTVIFFPGTKRKWKRNTKTLNSELEFYGNYVYGG